MSLLRELEEKFEKVFEGFFAKRFRSSLQPIELAKSLAREQDKKKSAGISGFYVPNHYLFFLSPEDFQKIQSLSPSLIRELQQFLFKRAQLEQYVLAGPPLVEIQARQNLAEGQFELESETQVEPGWEMPAKVEQTRVYSPEEAASLVPARKAFLIPQGKGEPFVIEREVIAVGRKEGNDLVIPDPSVSRHHARIGKLKESYYLEDLGSTNGSFVNGKRIRKRLLHDGDLVAFAEVEFRFRGE